jgi:calcineurin-like phosphoesterase family protein
MGPARRFFLAAVTLAVVANGSPAGAADPVIAAAGDIACAPTDPGYNGGKGTATRCRQRATSDLLVGAGLSAVLPLGDIQYDSPTAANLKAVYDPTWGRVKSISRPVLGNHDGVGTSYFDYFNGPGAANGPAGARGRGYYSFDVGAWHLVALNSNCATVSCGSGSTQEKWLRADLAAHPTACTLAFWHHPRYSSGHDGSHVTLGAFWSDLHAAGAELVLSGHSHNYERFAPKDQAGRVRPTGIRQFVVGTGGGFMTGIGTSRVAGSQVIQNTTFGVLKLALHPTSYDWRFVPIAGRTWTDAGSGQCHGPGGAPLAPAPLPGPVPGDGIRPVISGLRVKPRMFSRHTVFRYTLSEAAKVRLGISRVRAHGRARRVGRVRDTGATGANRRRFRRRVAGRRLPAGRYTARVVARDPAGNYSRPKKVGFRIVR